MEKIKISKAEFADMYEWSDEKEDAHDNIKEEEVKANASFEEHTEYFDKKDKDKWLSD